MQTATVTVQYVNQPKPGKRMGSIKGTDGNYYNVWPDKLPLFTVGQTYTLEYTEDNGFRSFKKIVEGGAQPVGQAANRVTAPMAAKKDRETVAEMFVMGFLNRCYQGASVVPAKAQIVAEGRMLRDAWNEIWTDAPARAPAPAVQPDDPLDDEIPF